MSLQIWLPLNGNLDNKGLADVEISNNGATVNSAGKIGSCYSFNGTSNYLRENNYTNFGSNYSICCWFYTSSSTQAQTLCSTRSAVGYGTSLFLNISGKLRIDSNTNGTSSLQWTTSYTYPINSWHHLTVIRNQNIVLYYVDGVFKEKKTLANYTQYFGNVLTIGCSQANGSSLGNYLIGRLNDFRVYDHCLSAAEVKEISKGLILHYPLNENLNVLNNCYSYPTFNTSTTSGGWSHWGSTGHKGNYGQNTNKNYIFNKNNTYSHWVGNGKTATASYLCYQMPAFAGGYRSLQCIVKEENSLPIDENIFYPAWNAHHGGAASNKWTHISSLGDGFYLCKCEGIGQDGSNDLVGFYVKPGYKVYISEAYLENDREICSDIFDDDKTTIYDTSGNGYNGKIIGQLNSVYGSARYQTSSLFNGDSYIRLNSPTSEARTVSFWAKLTNPKSSTYQVFFTDSASKLAFGVYSQIICNCGETRLIPFANTNFIDQQWNHIVITRPDTFNDVNLYINGIKQSHNSSGANHWGYSVGYLDIGSRMGVTSGQGPIKGYISDFRMYSTILSEDDIKELYQTSAKIDKNGTLHTYELVEDQEVMV